MGNAVVGNLNVYICTYHSVKYSNHNRIVNRRCLVNSQYVRSTSHVLGGMGYRYISSGSGGEGDDSGASR